MRQPMGLQPVIAVVCPDCAGTGNHTIGGGRDNCKDTCTTCGGHGSVDPQTGRAAHTSFPLAVKGTALEEPSDE